MFGLGVWEILVILLVALLVLGPKKLPEVARSLGRGLAEFRRASSEIRNALSVDAEPKKKYSPPEAKKRTDKTEGGDTAEEREDDTEGGDASEDD